MKLAIIGAGVIGGGWAARFLLNGWDVAVFDPHPEAARSLDRLLENARRSLPSLTDIWEPREGVLTFHTRLADAVSNADWIQESVPERLALKQQVLGEIVAYAPAHAVIGSSTSGFTPTQLQIGLHSAGQLLVCHPFNPVYLLPLVEVVPSERTDPAIRERCAAILREMGMKPLLIEKEIDAHVADRLLEAVWREALWLINDRIATTEEIDDAIRLGFGLRWAQMGLFETYRIAGGEGGIRHFISQFGPALRLPWTKLVDVPEFTEALVDRIVDQSDKQSGHLAIGELERIRDDNLVGILRVLKKNDWGAGAVINAHERRTMPLETDGPIEMVVRQIPPSWVDYNGHLNRGALS